VEGGSESACLAEFSHFDVVAGCSDQAGGEDDSGLAVCEDGDGVGFVGDAGIGDEEGRL
jgi:hypothetical protein